MTPQLGRIKKRADFLRAARGGRKWATTGLVLQAYSRRPPLTGGAEAGRAGLSGCPEAGGAAEVRVGFTASRKVGNAVARNRARRRLRALSRELLTAAGRPGTDYVLIARQGTLDRPFPLLRADLEAALDKVGCDRPRRPARPEPRP